MRLRLRGGYAIHTIVSNESIYCKITLYLAHIILSTIQTMKSGTWKILYTLTVVFSYNTHIFNGFHHKSHRSMYTQIDIDYNVYQNQVILYVTKTLYQKGNNH